MRIFPLHLFGPEAISADVVAKVISGGTALSGDEDIIATDGGGRWEGALSGLMLNTPHKTRVWSAWTSYWAGGARAFLMPVYSLNTAPRPMNGPRFMRPSALQVNDPVFPTSAAFASPYITAVTVGSAAIRATELTINITQGAQIQAGMRFSIGARAYKVEEVTDLDDLQAECVISPPLRAAVANGTAVNFEWPVVQAHIVPGQNLIPDMQFGRRGAVSVAFVEDFTEDPDGS